MQRHWWRTPFQLSCCLNFLSIINSKITLRQQLIARRRKLSSAHRVNSSKKAIENLLGYLSSYPPSTIGAYLAFDHELDITAGMQQLQQYGHRLAIPVIESNPTATMKFYCWHPEAKLLSNRFGIAEPDLTNNPKPLAADEFDVLLMPLVGFDNIGNRLGMGGGYYDRWLMSVDLTKPERIGIAYNWQQQSSIPFDKMDQPLSKVITDQGVIDCIP